MTEIPVIDYWVRLVGGGGEVKHIFLLLATPSIFFSAIVQNILSLIRFPNSSMNHEWKKQKMDKTYVEFDRNNVL